MDGLNYQNSCVQIQSEEMVKMQSCKKTNLLLHLTKLTKKVGSTCSSSILVVYQDEQVCRVVRRDTTLQHTHP